MSGNRREARDTHTHTSIKLSMKMESKGGGVLLFVFGGNSLLLDCTSFKRVLSHFTVYSRAGFVEIAG